MTEAEFWLTKDNARLYATDKHGYEIEITDYLYWFEDERILTFDGNGEAGKFKFRLVIKVDE